MISKVVPKLPYINKFATLQFYVQQLGFTLRSDYGEYLILDSPAAELHFFAYPNLVPSKSDFMIYLRVQKGIEELYLKLQKAGIAIHPHGQLETKSWRQREFAVTDPNGTLLTFGQAI
ncbi:bleomycin resistance protein [Adhaeribacter radiodurans]|uniref:Bleomycin resistance protein n=1 Tax=Adhaeribacter radiodurans TaxID=2745197 RepID=A0A7L7L5F7_9BACT|nr:VOC family protein [Adhaeribacter radiodurans]QMU28038.1 VOC family protein [Adhaeribacter radiodurans]